MPGFFEKRVTADIERRVRALRPGIVTPVVSSAYNPDGLCLRVRIDNDMYVDNTIFNLRWTAFIGADGDAFSMDPDPRLSQTYPLSIGAPASHVAPAIVQYLRSASPGLLELKARLIQDSES